MGSCQKLATDLVMGLLDYGSVLYYGLPNKVTKFQRLQNYAAKMAEINMKVQHWPDINCIGYLWRKG